VPEFLGTLEQCGDRILFDIRFDDRIKMWGGDAPMLAGRFVIVLIICRSNGIPLGFDGMSEKGSDLSAHDRCVCTR
jgi:hypothetical protein